MLFSFLQQKVFFKKNNLELNYFDGSILWFFSNLTFYFELAYNHFCCVIDYFNGYNYKKNSILMRFFFIYILPFKLHIQSTMYKRNHIITN